jgi:hypothetical protein
VGKWEHYYGYSAHARSRYEDAGYHHTETLTFSGRPVLPEGFKYPNVEITLSADKDFTDTAPDGFRAVIGTLDAAGDTLRAYAFVPGDHMAQLVAASGRVRVVSFTGHAAEATERDNQEREPVDLRRRPVGRRCGSPRHAVAARRVIGPFHSR